MLDFDELMLDPIEEAFGEALVYSPPGFPECYPFTGVWDRSEGHTDSGIRDVLRGMDASGGLVPYGNTLLVRDATFPVPGGPAQGGIVVRRGVRWAVNFVRPEEVGSTLCSMSRADD